MLVFKVNGDNKMKKFLSILLLLVLVSLVTVVAVNAAIADTYWNVSDDCLVKVKQLDDGTVPTFKKVIIDEEYGDYESMLVGLPATATVGDAYFQGKTDYTIKYYSSNGDLITDSKAHIGTGDCVKVFNSSNSPVAEYSLVTYGDADGDGVFDVIDSYYASLFANEKLTSFDAPAMFEAVKARAGFDDFYVQPEDYQEVVNGALKGENDNDKGRKIPVDSTINFESAIYAYDGSTKGAATIPDATFKTLATVTYNGSTTAPKAAGIYAVNATIANNEDYLVTPGTKNLGFVVIAPQVSTGYKVTADNANKKITIGTTDNDTPNATLAAAFEKWLNSAYTLNIGGTVNPSTVASALPNRSFEIYKGETQKTTLVKENSVAVLGSYLPDDETLWTNNTAANTKTVTLTNGTASFSFDLAFQQDAATIEAAKRAYFVDCADAARGQRTDYTSERDKSTGELIVSSDVKKVNLFVKMKNGYPTVRMAVKSSSATCANAIAGTGMKGVLVGRNDSVAFQASQTPDFTGKEVVSLFEDSGYRLSQYGMGDATKLMPVVNKVVAGMGISLPTNVILLGIKPVSSFVGKTGYCNYRCSGIGTNLRYNTVYFLEFVNYAGSGEDAHRTITVGTPANGTITVNPVNNYLHERVYEHTIMNAGEPVIVTATPASGYKLKAITVTKADGTQVSVGADGYFLMPDSNITINAEFEAK